MICLAQYALVVTALFSLYLPSNLLAADRIPTSILKSDRTPNPEEKNLIQSYGNQWSSLLVSEDDRQVAEAKRKLIEPFRSDPSTFFLNEYRNTLRVALRQAFEGQRDIIRINIMIISEGLKDSSDVSLYLMALKDPHPAVRYWAAKTLNSSAAAEAADPQQKELLTALSEAVKLENIELVTQQLMLALAQLTIQDAAPQILLSLNERIPVHLANPSMPLITETKALRRLSHQLIRKLVGEQSVPASHIQLITRVSSRYLRLVATQLSEQIVPEQVIDDYTKMAETADDSLVTFVDRQNISRDSWPTSITTELKPLIAQKDWLALKLRSEEWANLLVNTLGIDASKLDLKISSD